MGTFIKFYKKYLSFQRGQWFVRLIGYIAGVSLIVLNSYVIVVVGRLIDQVSSGEASLYDKLLQILFYLTLPFILEPITYMMRTISLLTGQRRFVSALYQKIICLDYKFHINKQTGKLITKILKASEIMALIAWDFEYWLFGSILEFFIPLFFVAMISIKLSILTLVVLVSMIPLIYLAVKLNVKYRAKTKDVEYERNALITDSIGNFTTVRAFGKEPREIELLDEKLADFVKAEMKYQRTWRLVDFVSRFAGISVFATAGYYAWVLYNTNEITLGQVIVVISYMLTFMGKVINLFFSLRNIAKEVPVMGDIIDIFEEETSIPEPAHPKAIKHPEGRITLQDVHFTYNKKMQVIEGISLSIEPRQTVAFVGHSGGGKTTLTKLIMRYYDPTQGKVLIDGVNTKDLSYESLRNLIGLVPQEPVLFNRSIYYNVAYAIDDNFLDKKAHYNMVVDACKKAQIHDFIESLPNGYETIVGERGMKLSGGQKQRIAIAQIIIKNPKIVIFDEATSQLDSESEKAIQAAFRELSNDKTTIIIAHRLSTITHCDKIFVIDDGKVREEGTHRKLLEINGIYANLWKIQSGGFGK